MPTALKQFSLFSSKESEGFYERLFLSVEFSQANPNSPSCQSADSLLVALLAVGHFFFFTFSFQAAALCTLSFPVAGSLQRAGWVTPVQVWGASFIQVGTNITCLLSHLVSSGHFVNWSTSQQGSWLVNQSPHLINWPRHLVSWSIGDLVSCSFSLLVTWSTEASWSPSLLNSPPALTWSRASFRGPQSEYRQQFVPCTATRFCTIKSNCNCTNCTN